MGLFNEINLEDIKLGDVIQFGPNYRTYISIHSESHGEAIQGPMSFISIGTLVSDLLKTSQDDIEIKIKKVFSKPTDSRLGD